jgi:hypothetical protein
MIRLLSLFLFIMLVGCTQDCKDNYELTIINYDYSMAYSLKYKMTNDNFNIVFSGELEGEQDSVIYSQKLESRRLIKKLSKLNLESLKENYENPCVLDGTQISIILKRNDENKVIHISNYYKKEIAQSIKLINELVPVQYLINYNKDVLIQYMKDCQ